MPTNDSQLFSLLQGIQSFNPRLYELLRGILVNLSNVNNTLFPATESTTPVEETVTAVADVSTFTYTLVEAGMRLTWERNDPSQIFFEIREGTDWDTSPRIEISATISAILDPRLAGTYHFLIKAIGIDGSYSTNATALDVIIPALGDITISAEVIDNNVLLRWTEPEHIFRLARYEIRKGVDLLGTQTGTFIAIFEQLSGSYTYSVIAYDVAGNASSSATVTAEVSQPPDYVLQANFVSSLNGTITNGTLEPGPRLLVCTRNETWQQHFEDRGWTCIQDQINAGFPLYIQPAETTASYVEVIDYGLILTDTIITITYNSALISGSGVTVLIKLEASNDNISYGTPVFGAIMFAASIRYLRLTLTFTAID